MNEYVKCDCWNCGQTIEFNSSAVDWRIGAPMITCPNCFRDTQLYVPDSPLTAEAVEFLDSLTSTSVPVFISNKLRRIALANGIGISDSDTASNVIERLQARQSYAELV